MNKSTNLGLNQQLAQLQSISQKCAQTFYPTVNDSKFHSMARYITFLSTRLNKPEICIGVCGEIKVGKSTWINNFLGDNICPTDDKVTTSVPSVFRYGQHELIQVYFNADDKGEAPTPVVIDRKDIAAYVTESGNTKNAKAVHHLEFHLPNDRLKDGIVLIDTAGLGALNTQHAAATFGIASKADVLFFFGNTDKQLSTFEIDSLTQLVKCSHCLEIHHVITCADRGDVDTIAKENSATLRKAFPDRKINIHKISSTIYSRYLENGDERYLRKSGYESVFAAIGAISERKAEIVGRLCGNEALVAAHIIQAELDEIMKISTDPIKFENNAQQLEKCAARIQELQTNSKLWTSSAESKHLAATAAVRDFITRTLNEICDDIDTLVQDDVYFKDSNKLCTAIQARMSVFSGNLNNCISNHMEQAYTDLRNETGLSKLAAQINLPGLENISTAIPDDCGKLPAFNNARNLIGSAIMGGVVAHVVGVTATAIGIPAIGAKIGFLIGSVAPGIGNLIGTFGGFILGGLIGLLICAFTTKASKRRKMAEDCKAQVNKFFAEVRVRVADAMSNNRHLLAKQFAEELAVHSKSCNQQWASLAPIAIATRDNWNTITAMRNATQAVIDKLSADVSAKPSDEMAKAS